MKYVYNIGKIPSDLIAFKSYLQDVLVDVSDVAVVDGEEILVEYGGVLRDNDKTTLDSLVASYSGLVRVDNAPEVKIRQEWVKTGGNYRIEGLTLAACSGGGATTVGTFNWPYGISVLGLKLCVGASNDGDVINGWIAPSGNIGVVVESVGGGVGVQSIKVSASVFDYLYVGYELIVGGVSLGNVVGIDKIGGVVSFDGVVDANIPAMTGVSFKRCVAKNVKLCSGMNLTIGDRAIGAAYLPAGVNIVVDYTNNHASNVDFDFCMEYYY